MIVRRITAGAAAVALAGTAFVAAPAMAKSNTTTLKLDDATLGIISGVGIKASAVKPAKLKKTTVTFPAKLKGSKVNHTGGLKLAAGDKFLTVQDISINIKNGKANATVDNSFVGPKAIKNVLLFKGGKNTIKKNGKWTKANVYLAKSVDIPDLGTLTTQEVLSTVFGVDKAVVEQYLPGEISLGTATVNVKK